MATRGGRGRHAPALAALLAYAACVYGEAGLSLSTFDNGAWYGEPKSVKIITEVDLVESVSTGQSLELTGSMELPKGYATAFRCNFSSSVTLAFLWIDDHMVCHRGAFSDWPAPGRADNPLRRLSKTRLPFVMRILVGAPPAPRPPVKFYGCYLDGSGGAPGPRALRYGPQSYGYTAQSCAEACRGYSIVALQDVSNRTNMQGWCSCDNDMDRATREGAGPSDCRDVDHPWVNTIFTAAPAPPTPAPGSQSFDMAVSVEWQQQTEPAIYGHDALPAGPWRPLRDDEAKDLVVTSELPPLEIKRRELQGELATGWGTWVQPSVLTVSNLPSGAAFAPDFCQLSSSLCVSETFPGAGLAGNVRVGAHSYPYSIGSGRDRFAELTIDLGELRVNISWCAGAGRGGSLAWVATAQPLFPGNFTGNWSDYEVRFHGTYTWKRPGTINVKSDQQLQFSSFGFGRTSLTAIGGSKGCAGAGNGSTICLTLSPQGVAITSDSRNYANLSRIKEAVDAARASELAASAEWGDLADTKIAVQAAVMWNLIYNPAEAGPFTPVSRQWNFAKTAVSKDWDYVIFDWDNLFASLMFGGLGEPEARASAYSTLIQVIRSKTARGFVPNFSAAGEKSQDRSEEVIGAKVLLEIYRAYGDEWLVELLFDDLYDWMSWMLTRRTLPPLGLITLGSDNITAQVEEAAMNKLQGARYEQADDGPGFDCPGSDPSTGRPDGPACDEIFNRTTGLLTLYNVGQTGLVTMELLALAELADAINRPEGASLRQRAAVLQQQTRDTLWDDELGIFISRFASGKCPPNLTLCDHGFYRRVAPTSFFPMLGGSATDEQVQDMIVSWLFNRTRFCVTPDGDFKGNSEDCYWGLPSISADDPAFPLLGYWRGLVWAPWAQLTYWALDEYAHLESAVQGRKALARQMTAMMMEIWTTKRHICENFSPHKDGGRDGDCTGTRFYHWGGLAGLMSLLEAQK